MPFEKNILAQPKQRQLTQMYYKKGHKISVDQNQVNA